jgi:hypothetical protein
MRLVTLASFLAGAMCPSRVGRARERPTQLGELAMGRGHCYRAATACHDDRAEHGHRHLGLRECRQFRKQEFHPFIILPNVPIHP